MKTQITISLFFILMFVFISKIQAQDPHDVVDIEESIGTYGSLNIPANSADQAKVRKLTEKTCENKSWAMQNLNNELQPNEGEKSIDSTEIKSHVSLIDGFWTEQDRMIILKK